MKKIKLDNLLKILGTYSDELAKQQSLIKIKREEIYNRIIKLRPTFKYLEFKRIAIGFALFLLLLGLSIYLNKIFKKDTFLRIKNFQGKIFIAQNDTIYHPVSKNVKILEGNSLLTKKDSIASIKTQNENNYVLIKIGSNSKIKFNKINLFTFLELNLIQGEFFIDIKSQKKHIIKFCIGNYKIYLTGSKIYFKFNRLDDIKILLLEGNLNIKLNDKLLKHITSRSKVTIINSNIYVDKIPKNEIKKIKLFSNSMEKKTNITTKKEKIFIGNEHFYCINKKYFCIHNFSSDLYLYSNHSGEMLLHLKLPCRTKSIPLIFDNKIYISGYDKKLYFYSIPKKKWFTNNLSGCIFYSAPVVYNGNILLIDTNGNLYCINTHNKIIKKTKSISNVWAQFVIENNLLFVGTYDENFYCYSLLKDKVVWQTKISERVIYFKPVIISNIIIIRTENNSIYAFDKRNGKIKWKVKTSSKDFVFYLKDNLYIADATGNIKIINYLTGATIKNYATNKKLKDIFIYHLNQIAFIDETKHLLIMDLLKNKTKRTGFKGEKLFFNPSYNFFYIYTINNKMEKQILHEYLF